MHRRNETILLSMFIFISPDDANVVRCASRTPQKLKITLDYQGLHLYGIFF